MRFLHRCPVWIGDDGVPGQVEPGMPPPKRATAAGQGQGACARAPGPAGLPALDWAEEVDGEGYPSAVHTTAEGQRGVRGKMVFGDWVRKTTEFPDGGLERTVTWVPTRRPSRRGSSSPRADRTDSARRSARKCRNLIRQHSLTAMWTFTYPAPGQHDRDAAFAEVAAFLEDYGQPLLRGQGYVTVLELHPDGHGWHVHCFTGGGRYPKPVLGLVRHSWTRFLARRGFTPSGGATSVRVQVHLWRSGRSAGVYAGKYAVKAFQESARRKGARRYTLSLGLSLRVIRHTGSLLELLAPVPGLTLARHWDCSEVEGWQGYPTTWEAWEPPPP